MVVRQVLVFAFVIILVHCYYGYFASGGPSGVGVAVGHAVRAALVLIALLDFFLGLAIWERRQPFEWEARRPMSATVRQRLLGLIFLLVCIGFLAFTILQFNKAFVVHHRQVHHRHRG